MMDFTQDLVSSRSRQTVGQKLAECPLVHLVLVNVRDAELRLPVEGMRGALKDLLLLRDAVQHELKGGAPEVVAKSAGAHLLSDLSNTPANTAKRLQPLGAFCEPSVIDRLLVTAIGRNDLSESFFLEHS